MINELKSQLAREKARKKEFVGILDKRIKNLEKAINSLSSYNEQQKEVKEKIYNYEIESVVETDDC